MKRKLLSVLLAGTMVLSLAACGNSGSSDDASSEGGGSEGGNKLTVWAWDQTFNIKAIQMAGEQYAKDHDGFEIEVIETSSDDCQTKLTTCANAGDYSTMPDIVLMQDNSYQKFLKSYPDAFTDLTDCGINWDDFATLKQSYSMADDKHYGVPYDNGVCAAFYRTDILEEAGYKIEDLTDITWSQFTDIAVDVHKKTGKYLLTSESTGGDVIMLMIQSCGANFVNEKGEAYIVGNDVAEKCIDLYTDMIKKDAVKLVNNWDEYISTVTGGEAVGIINGNWMNATLTGIEDQAGKWQITTLPKVDGVDTATNYANNGGSSWYVTSNCKNTDLAFDFLAKTFAGSEDLYSNILPTTGAIGTWGPAGESEAYQAPQKFWNDKPIYSTIVEYAELTPTNNTSAYYQDVREVISTAIQDIMTGADAESTLEQAQADAEFYYQ